LLVWGLHFLFGGNMENIDFVKGLDTEKIYIFGFPNSWNREGIEEFFKYTRDLGIKGIGVYSEGFQIIEPVGLDKEKLRELL
jgi:hypothetical protein